MPVYDPITNVMPLAAMVTNATVSAALCDQIRDDLVALRSGWWFRATRTAATQTTTASDFTPIEFDTIVMSDTATADLSISLVAGSVQTTKVGLWMFGGHVQVSSTTTVIDAAIVRTVAGVPAYVGENLNETSGKNGSGCSAICQVTSAINSFEFAAYGGVAVSVLLGPWTTLWGVWLGGAP
jgi:hypothetical protein